MALSPPSPCRRWWRAMAWCRRRRPRRGWLPASPACVAFVARPKPSRRWSRRRRRRPHRRPRPRLRARGGGAKAKSAASTGLWDVLAFSGPAPEPINRRLAMVGFV
ncbi:Os04g0267950 [Oryza sativa Japonica Group]|uniref:Os04g0267950 protein n=1 Tax=Oryza sativa subsp. japonica TaxID=39947 RepID=A0A0P0W7X7_ORYSJ|nr:Os04g0267950 [Oryza sativa Japonica Group]